MRIRDIRQSGFYALPGTTTVNEGPPGGSSVARQFNALHVIGVTPMFVTELIRFVFVPIIEKIIQHGAVSGGCFPSSHVAGAWGVVFGLWPFHRRKALFFGFFALGLSLACVFTRYHHGVDVPAGFTAGLVAAVISYRWNASNAPAE